ncbi:MAG: DUF6580 family putative transport protein [Chthoniobacterales bacterium]
MPAALFLIFVAILIRIVPPLLHVHHDWMGNFSPLASLVLCGAVFFPKRMAAWVPFLILLVSDFTLNIFAYSTPMLSWELVPRYFIFAVIGSWAFSKRETLGRKPMALLGTSVAASVFFYVATNTVSWVGDAGYAKTFAGWAQALTTGLPGLPSTISFFRNSLVSDVLFTGLFLICMAVTSKKSAVQSRPVVAV